MLRRMVFAWFIGLFFASAAMAATYNWTFQNIPNSVNTLDSVGLAMQTGSTWPVVFGGIDGGSSAGAYSLKPVGWIPTSLGSAFINPSAIKAESALNGQVGAVWSTGTSIEFAQSSANGWLKKSFTTSDKKPDLAFTKNSLPIISSAKSDGVSLAAYSGSRWDQFVISQLKNPTTGQTFPLSGMGSASVAVDSQDSICMAYSLTTSGVVGFAFSDVSSGNWYGTQITNVGGTGAKEVSLAFNANNEVGVAMLVEDDLLYSSFDPGTGQWATETVAEDISSMHVNLVFDNLGNPALAYASMGSVFFSTNTGSGWANYVLPTQGQPSLIPSGMTDAALAFDADNLPVIAYDSDTSGLVLAYDPILTPEPASAILILLGAGALVLRRKVALA